MAWRPITKRNLTIVTCVAAGLILGGCGVKGAPEPPPDVPPEDVRSPAPRTPPPEGEEPSEPFILDPLLL